MKIQKCGTKGMLTLLAGVLVLLCATSARSQTAAPSAPLPTDPKELLAQAARLNGLHGDDLKPWHIKVSFQLTNENGTPGDEGTMEEWWRGADQFKIVYANAKLTKTIYGMEKGFVITGSREVLPDYFVEIRNAVMEPIPFPSGMVEPAINKIDVSKSTLGGVELKCLAELFVKSNYANQHGNSYCFSLQFAYLRVETQSGSFAQILQNQIVRFSDHYIARELVGFHNSNPHFKAHVELLELLKDEDVAGIAPPTDSNLVEPVDEVPPICANFIIYKREGPVYPLEAKQSHISGTVVFKVRVNKDGTIATKEIISGPNVLRKSSMDALAHWVYRPYTVYGKPTDFTTKINVIYSLE